MSKKNKTKNTTSEKAKSTEKSAEQPVGEATETAAATTFSQLQPDQIERLRDSFQVIDKDNDGDLCVNDIKSTYKSIGKELSDEGVMKMMEGNNENGMVGFPSYLSIMSRELSQLPNNTEIKRALQVFSQDMELNSDELRKSLLGVGMKENEINSVLTSFMSERMNGEKIFMGSSFLGHISY